MRLECFNLWALFFLSVVSSYMPSGLTRIYLSSLFSCLRIIYFSFSILSSSLINFYGRKGVDNIMKMLFIFGLSYRIYRSRVWIRWVIRWEGRLIRRRWRWNSRTRKGWRRKRQISVFLQCIFQKNHSDGQGLGHIFHSRCSDSFRTFSCCKPYSI